MPLPRLVVVVMAGVLLLGGCTGTDPEPSGGSPGSASAVAPTGGAASGSTPAASDASAPVASDPAAGLAAPEPGDSSSASPSATPTPPPAPFDAEAAFAVVEELAEGIGPREAASARFRAAAALVATRLRELGYDVERQRLPVPAGTSWGVPVRDGTTRNVIATPPGFDPDEPHRLIGAHLDTVPQAPGAEDNASGVGVLLELARLAAEQPPVVPVVFVAFGGEEPRGSGDSMHHFGSRYYVAELPDDQREALLGMVSLDRVGVRGPRVPVCFGGLGTDDVQEELVEAAAEVDVRVQRCQNRTSDHWSFEKADLPAARMGGIEYDEYHSSADLPEVVSTEQLDRVGRIAEAWMRNPE